jgi:hypothetical protein
VAVAARAHRGDWRRRWLAGCIALLLAIAPVAHSSSTFDFVRVASAESITSIDDVPAKQSSPALRPAQPLSLGILSRVSLLESALGLPPAKAPSPGPSAPQAPVTAIRAATAFGGNIGQVFHHDSVGTARTPTGPPS